MQEDVFTFLKKDPKIKISVNTQKDEVGREWVVVSIEDSGTGWDWEEMPEDVWERYRYVKSATEKNSGIFEYKAVKGKGAVVTLKFPDAESEIKREIADCNSQSDQMGGVGMKKVLIVDDESVFTKDFAKALKMFGYIPYMAIDGEGALNIIDSQKPDVVMCDYKLPDVEGDKILKESKTKHPEIKFVMLTAYYDEDVAQRFRNLGADEVIFKPIVLTEIEALLAKLTK